MLLLVILHQAQSSTIKYGRRCQYLLRQRQNNELENANHLNDHDVDDTSEETQDGAGAVFEVKGGPCSEGFGLIKGKCVEKEN